MSIYVLPVYSMKSSRITVEDLDYTVLYNLFKICEFDTKIMWLHYNRGLSTFL